MRVVLFACFLVQAVQQRILVNDQQVRGKLMLHCAKVQFG